jgi:hypothetical protein
MGSRLAGRRQKHRGLLDLKTNAIGFLGLKPGFSRGFSLVASEIENSQDAKSDVFLSASIASDQQQ